MISDRTRRIVVVATRLVSGIALVTAVGFLALQLVPGQQTQTTAPQVPDTSDPAAMAFVNAVVDASVVRSPLFVEYDKGALKIALPNGTVEKGPVYVETISGLCAHFRVENILLTDIALLNNAGTSGLFLSNASQVCDTLSGAKTPEEKTAVIEAAATSAPAAEGEGGGVLWKTAEGRALFGPPTQSPEASIAALGNVGVSADLLDDLALYAPIHVATAEGRLIVALPRNVVTPDVLGPLLVTLCQRPAGDQANTGLVVLNRYFTQGLALGDDALACGADMPPSGTAAKSWQDTQATALMCPDRVTDCLNQIPTP